jgi:hypothetical protein
MKLFARSGLQRLAGTPDALDNFWYSSSGYGGVQPERNSCHAGTRDDGVDGLVRHDVPLAQHRVLAVRGSRSTPAERDQAGAGPHALSSDRVAAEPDAGRACSGSSRASGTSRSAATGTPILSGRPRVRRSARARPSGSREGGPTPSGRLQYTIRSAHGAAAGDPDAGRDVPRPRLLDRRPDGAVDDRLRRHLDGRRDRAGHLHRRGSSSKACPRRWRSNIPGVLGEEGGKNLRELDQCLSRRASRTPAAF